LREKEVRSDMKAYREVAGGSGSAAPAFLVGTGRNRQWHTLFDSYCERPHCPGGEAVIRLRRDSARLVIESRKKMEITHVRQVPERRKIELLAALEAFAGLVIKDAGLVRRLVWEGKMDLEESVTVRAWMREGEKKGVQKGVLQARRRALLSVLSARFGRVGKTVESRILRIKDAVLLEKLIKRAAVVPNQRQFSREVPD